jgi:5-methylcytosine-specific restriction endonuclease McrA
MIICQRCHQLKDENEFYLGRKWCKKCWSDYYKEYYQKNKEKIKERVEKYRLLNKEKINEYNKNWIRKNKAKHKSYHKKWYEKKKQENPEYFIKWAKKIREWHVKYTKEYRRKNRAWYLEQKQKRRAREKNGPGLTKDDILFLLKQQKNKCFYCGIDIGNSYTVDHKIPLCRNGLNEISNVVMTCRSCNVKKGKRTTQEYFEVLRKLKTSNPVEAEKGIEEIKNGKRKTP